MGIKEIAMRINRKEISFVRAGFAVRVNVSLDSEGLTREEQKEATEGLASDIMRVLSSARFVNAPLSKIRVR